MRILLSFGVTVLIERRAGAKQTIHEITLNNTKFLSVGLCD